MKYMNKSIKDIHDLIKKNKVTPDELFKESVELSKNVQDKYNPFVTILSDMNISDKSDSLLYGICYGAKDNYSTKGILTTGGSNSLKDYKPIYNATVIEKLNKEGAILVNKTTMDEFGMGGTGTTGHTGIQKNPWDLKRMCGGSSSGSVAAVALGVYPFALGSDTGDSIRKPASFCGVVGYKPTYGMISRYGLLPYASSLDHCGVITRSVEDAAIVVDAIKGKDINDMTTWDSSKLNLYKSLDNDLSKKKLCYIKEFIDKDDYKDKNVLKNIDIFNKLVDDLRNKNIKVDEVSIDKKLLRTISPVYTVIADAEATSNMSNLNGIAFGPRGSGDNYIEMIKNHRTEGFSPLIKRRFIIGSYVLQKDNQEIYFRNAQRVRRLIVNKWKELFKSYDAIILPSTPSIAPLLDNIKSDDSLLNNHLQVGNFGGFPSISIPYGFVDNMPVGLSITGNCYDDINVLNIAYGIEGMMDYKNQCVGDGSDE